MMLMSAGPCRERLFALLSGPVGMYGARLPPARSRSSLDASWRGTEAHRWKHRVEPPRYKRPVLGDKAGGPRGRAGEQ
jgi:hypothetical protein